MIVTTCDRCGRDVHRVPEVRREGMRLARVDFTLPDGSRRDLCSECFVRLLDWIQERV